ncbi:hypothetical protein FIBSPDRAFT_932191 [Athelia psychrophila]|uniref:Uncharacterized protein n=1 Tax=Athelia psychrophila TaxID=1759441 RepID=A0A166J4I4_9AGAM|nr:hypothetical protein FIBSPDRAFT_932191 [Fibularhizoctonia sp. CBS 109695]
MISLSHPVSSKYHHHPPTFLYFLFKLANDKEDASVAVAFFYGFMAAMAVALAYVCALGVWSIVNGDLAGWADRALAMHLASQPPRRGRRAVVSREQDDIVVQSIAEQAALYEKARQILANDEYNPPERDELLGGVLTSAAEVRLSPVFQENFRLTTNGGGLLIGHSSEPQERYRARKHQCQCVVYLHDGETKQSSRTSLPFNAPAFIIYSSFSWALNLILLSLSRSLLIHIRSVLNPSLSSRSRLPARRGCSKRRSSLGGAAKSAKTVTFRDWSVIQIDTPRCKLSQGLTMDAGKVGVYRISRDSMAQWIESYHWSKLFLGVAEFSSVNG